MDESQICYIICINSILLFGYINNLACKQHYATLTMSDLGIVLQWNILVIRKGLGHLLVLNGKR